MNDKIERLIKESGLVTTTFCNDNNYEVECYTHGEGIIPSTAQIQLMIDTILREYSYDMMNVHCADPERIAYVAKNWGVEL